MQRRLPGVEMTAVGAHMASYSLFATDHQRQVVFVFLIADNITKSHHLQENKKRGVISFDKGGE